MSKINKIKIKDVSYDIEDLSIGDLNELETTDKSNLVNAINEVLSNAGGGSWVTELTKNTGLYGKPYGFYTNKTTSIIYVSFGSTAPTSSNGIILGPNSLILYCSDGGTPIIVRFDYDGLFIYHTDTTKYTILKYANLMTLSTNQTITGTKTFNTLPQSSKTPTSNNQLVNKKYVDDKFASSSGGSSNETYSTTETPIGTYINGETVYRKVVVGNLDGTWVENSKTFSWVDLGVKVDKVLRLNVCFDRDTEYKFTEASNVDLVVSVRSRPDYDTSDVQIGLKTSYSIGQEIHIIIEYTKATE